MILQFLSDTLASHSIPIATKVISNPVFLSSVWVNFAITILTGLILGGAGIKWFNTFLKKKREDRQLAAADSIAFRENLLQRVQEMNSKLETMYEKQLELVAQNSSLEAQLAAANNELHKLRTEISLLKR